MKRIAGARRTAVRALLGGCAVVVVACGGAATSGSPASPGGAVPSLSPSTPAGALPAPTPDSSAIVRAEAVEGPYRLVLELEGDTFAANEPIDGRARLELASGAVELVGAGSGLIAFDIVEVDGSRRMEAAWTSDCAVHHLEAGRPIETSIVKSGGFSAEDPNADFYRQFFADPLVRLPAGRWEVAAVATFAVGECGGREVTLRAPITITVGG